MYEDLSKRKQVLPQLKLNNFTSFPPTNTHMVVYESGHKGHCEPGWHTRLRVYDHYLIHYILNGKGVYYTPSGSYPVKKGDLFIIRPDEAIHYLADLDTPWTYYWFGFNGNEAYNIMRLCGFSENTPVVHYGDSPEIKELLHKLVYPEFTGISREYELLGYLYGIFSLLIQKQPHPAITKAEQYLSAAIEYIQKQYGFSGLKVNNVANYIGIDRTYLYRIFYDSLHISVQEFIQQFRLDKAKALLKFSNIPIGLIAHNCGFENQAYFSTIFKRYYNMSPTKYRKLENQMIFNSQKEGSSSKSYQEVSDYA